MRCRYASSWLTDAGSSNSEGNDTRAKSQTASIRRRITYAFQSIDRHLPVLGIR
jgi:hypothetical protein